MDESKLVGNVSPSNFCGRFNSRFIHQRSGSCRPLALAPGLGIHLPAVEAPRLIGIETYSPAIGQLNSRCSQAVVCL